MPATPTVSLNRDTRLQLRADLVRRSFQDDSFVIDPQAAQIVGLNPVGYQVLEWLAEPRRVTELAELVCRDFEVSAETAESDLLPFLRQCLDSHLVETVAP